MIRRARVCAVQGGRCGVGLGLDHCRRHLAKDELHRTVDRVDVELAWLGLGSGRGLGLGLGLGLGFAQWIECT